jgi:GAF domain-containing protein
VDETDGSGEGAGSVLAAVCDLAVLAAHGDGGTVTGVSNGAPGGVVHATDEMALDLARLQFLLAEGPSVDAGRFGHPLLVADLSLASNTDARWLTFSAEALVLGVGAIFAFPLQVGAARVGVLTVHRGRPGGLDGPGIIAVLRLADRLALVLIDRLVSLEQDYTLGDLRLSDGHHEGYLQTSTHQATGILSARLRVSLAEALAELRATAFAMSKSVNDVADDVVAGRLVFAVDTAGQITHDTHG